MAAPLQTDERLPRSAAELTLLALLAAVVITIVGGVITRSAAINMAENRFLATVSDAHTPLGDTLALAVNVGFGTIGAVIVTVLGAVIAGVLARSGWESLRFVLLVGIPWGAVELVKHLVQRPRPNVADLPNVLIPEPSSYSYPSGHTAFGAALGLSILVLMIRHRFRRAVIIAAVVLAAVLALGAAWSRMYLGVHHPTDVTASLILVPCVSAAVAAWISVVDPPEFR